MKPSRRHVLLSLSALPLAPACTPPEEEPPPDGPTPPVFTTGGPEPEPWDAPGTFDDSAFAWGVQSADPTPDSVLLSLQTTEPVVGLIIVEGTEPGWTEVLDQEGLEVGDGGFAIEVTDLRSDTTYSFVFTAGERRSTIGRFRTALGDDDYRPLVFGASSCLGNVGRPFPSLTRASEEPLDFFCLLGDIVYADSSDTVEEYRATYRTNMQQSGFVDVTASTSIIATWDDHEVDNNWTWDDAGIDARFPAAQQVFREHIPQRIGPGGTGIWRSLKWGDVLEMFVLDCRAERRDGRYISVEQMEWFKAGLQASTARFKVVLNSVAITNYQSWFGEVFIEDRWEGYAQRAEILEWIHDQEVTGVFWIAGDFHFGSLGHVDPPGEGIADTMWEALAGPAGSNPLALSDLFQPDDQVEFFISEYTWLRIEADPAAGTLHLQFLDNDNQVVQERELTL